MERDSGCDENIIQFRQRGERESLQERASLDADRTFNNNKKLATPPPCLYALFWYSNLHYSYISALGNSRITFYRWIKLHHPHIVQFLGWVKNSDGFGIAMEHMPRGSVEEYVEARGGDIPKAVKLTWCDHTAQALTYLHNRKPDFLIHRDVKPANFLLTPSLQCKLADFGVVRCNSFSVLLLLDSALNNANAL